MTTPAFHDLPSPISAGSRDILWGRPQFRPPSLDRLLALLDFRAFAAELSRGESFQRALREPAAESAPSRQG